MGRKIFEILVGTYEEYVLGYQYFFKTKESKQSFATHSHNSSVRCLDVCGRYLASGSTDDKIVVYDLKERKEHHTLTHHNATVNCVRFTPEHTHIISGSADGVLAIVRIGNWQLEKLWEKAHKGAAVVDIAVHPSGKLALTLGADASLCTWNLVKGRQAYVTNLNTKSKDAKSLTQVLWAPCGTRFSLSGGRYTEIWSIEKAGILQATEHKNKVTACVWLANDSLLVGHENGEITAIKTESTMTQAQSCKAHDSRVKAISVVDKFIATTSSNGEVKVWNKRLELVHEWNSGCRNTCLCIAPVIFERKVDEVSEEETTKVERPAVKVVRRKPGVVVTVEHDDDNDLEVVPKKKKKKQKKSSNG